MDTRLSCGCFILDKKKYSGRDHISKVKYQKKKEAKIPKFIFCSFTGLYFTSSFESLFRMDPFPSLIENGFKISEMMKITILNFPSKHTPTFPTNNHVYFHDVSDEVKD